MGWSQSKLQPGSKTVKDTLKGAGAPLGECGCDGIKITDNHDVWVDGSYTGSRFTVRVDGKVGINCALHDPLTLFDVRGGTSLLEDQTLVCSQASFHNWEKVTTDVKSKWGLWVDKGVVATDYAITTSDHWADFVFDAKYKLRPLAEIEDFVKVNKHLPDIPSAESLKEKGYTLQDMNAKFMQKIEELTLYTIEQDKQIKELQKQVQALAARIEVTESAKK